MDSNYEDTDVAQAIFIENPLSATLGSKWLESLTGTEIKSISLLWSEYSFIGDKNKHVCPNTLKHYCWPFH